MNKFTVYVDYKLPPRKELEKKYEETGGLCPMERHSPCKDIDETPGEREFLLAEVPTDFLGKSMNESFDSLSLHFDKCGYRFAVECELDALATAHPGLQRDYYIYALGSYAGSERDRHFPFAGYNCKNGKRTFHVDWRDTGMITEDRILLVRKSA